jgi:flagellar assembly factor FliW
MSVAVCSLALAPYTIRHIFPNFDMKTSTKKMVVQFLFPVIVNHKKAWFT